MRHDQAYRFNDRPIRYPDRRLSWRSIPSGCYAVRTRGFVSSLVVCDSNDKPIGWIPADDWIWKDDIRD
jgi:hypothetical protein